MSERKERKRKSITRKGRRNPEVKKTHALTKIVRQMAAASKPTFKRRPRSSGSVRNTPSTKGAIYAQSAVAGVGSSLVHRLTTTGFKDDRGNIGVRASGFAPVAVINFKTGGTTQCILSQPNLADATKTSNELDVNPYAMFSTASNELNLMKTFTKFRFTKLKCVFNTGVNTGVIGQVMFGYYADGAIESVDVTNQVMYAQPGTISCPVWATGVGTDVSDFLDKSTYFYTDYDIGTDPEARLTCQGAIIGNWKIQPQWAQPYGDLFIDYEIELIEPRAALDLVPALSVPYEIKREYVTELRRRRHQAFADFAAFKGFKYSHSLLELKESKEAKKVDPDPLYIVHEGSRMGETYVYQNIPLESKIVEGAVTVASGTVTVDNKSLDVKVVNPEENPAIVMIAPASQPIYSVVDIIGQDATISTTDPLQVTIVPAPEPRSPLEDSVMVSLPGAPVPLARSARKRPERKK
jgi:hypothetical protein